VRVTALLDASKRGLNRKNTVRDFGGQNFAIITESDYCRLSHHFRELGDGGCDPPRFVAAEQLHDRSPPRVVLVIDKGQFLATARLHHKATREILNEPRRLKIPAFRRGVIAGANGLTTDDKREQVLCFHFVNDKDPALGDRGKRTTDRRPQGSLERGVRAELSRSGDQLMVPRHTPQAATTTAGYASIAFIAHRIV
jgi:hypothetical protein